MEEKWNQWQTFIFLSSKIVADGDCSHEIKRFLVLGRKAMANLDSMFKSRDITLPTKVCIVKAMLFPVVMYRLESWTVKKAECWRIDAFWSVVLEKTPECPLDCKGIKAVNPKGNQPWTFTGRTDAEADASILWPPDAKSWLIGNVPDAGKDWRQEEKGMTEDEVAGCHHCLNGREFEQAPMSSLSQWTWVWASSKRWWRTGEPGVLQSMGMQSHTQLSDWMTEQQQYRPWLQRSDWIQGQVIKSHGRTLIWKAACSICSGHKDDFSGKVMHGGWTRVD